MYRRSKFCEQRTTMDSYAALQSSFHLQAAYSHAWKVVANLGHELQTRQIMQVIVLIGTVKALRCDGESRVIVRRRKKQCF
jgi:hypothetical protein